MNNESLVDVLGICGLCLTLLGLIFTNTPMSIIGLALLVCTVIYILVT